jgi:hypothetical protein
MRETDRKRKRGREGERKKDRGGGEREVTYT